MLTVDRESEMNPGSGATLGAAVHDDRDSTLPLGCPKLSSWGLHWMQAGTLVCASDAPHLPIGLLLIGFAFVREEV